MQKHNQAAKTAYDRHIAEVRKKKSKKVLAKKVRL